jgi:low temperature requirement protein LtrA
VSTQYGEQEHRVTPLELFFDLVFVFAFTEVTTLLTHDPTWTGLGHGVLVLAALWWAWSSYAWLTNAVDPEEGRVMGAMLVATASMFVAALAVPSVFAEHGVLFGVAFLVVEVMFIALYKLAARGDENLLSAVVRLVPSTLAGSALIIGAGFVDGALKSALWLAAVAVGLFGPLLGGLSGWRIHAAHFVERHGLIVIIAVGESVVAIGLGANGTALTAGVVVAALLGLVVATSFWLAYFDFFAIRAERLLGERSGAERAGLARDVYGYLHLPMVLGIVLFAFAMKTTLKHVGSELDAVSAFCLCCGPALYLFAYVGIRLRISHSLGSGRLVAGIACALLFPVALVVPALAAVALVAVVWVALHTYEFVWWREARAETRALRVSASAQ